MSGVPSARALQGIARFWEVYDEVLRSMGCTHGAAKHDLNIQMRAQRRAAEIIRAENAPHSPAQRDLADLGG